MMVGCYSLDLYCDDPEHAARETTWNATPVGRSPVHPRGFWNLSNYVPASQFTGRNLRDCRSDAAKLGWRIRGNKATCPRCADPERFPRLPR